MSKGFKKAVRKQVKHKIALVGPSGSGKSLGALKLAYALAPTGKVAAIDSENESLSYYAGAYDFDTLELRPPYTTDAYIEAINMAVAEGYEALVIDSLSHQWAGEGGILDRKGQMDKRGGNSYTNWAPFTSEHEKFKSAIMNAPIHVIGTIRAKQDYVLEENGKGRAAPKKVGLAPVQREAFEYEFGLAFELQMDHRAIATKDRTGLFGIDPATGQKGPFFEQLVDLTDPRVGQALVEWAERGVEAPQVDAAMVQALEAAVTRAEMLDPDLGAKFRDRWTKNRLTIISTPEKAQEALDAMNARLKVLDPQAVA